MNIVGVNISECVLSDQPETVLVAHSLGSCLGASFYDYKKKIGAMIHCLLPFYEGTPKKLESPAMFVDTGVKKVIEELQCMGCNKHNIIVNAAGGSFIMDPKGIFNIGKRNYKAFQESMVKQGMAIKNTAIGGDRHRTLSLEIRTGRVTVKNGKEVVEL